MKEKIIIVFCSVFLTTIINLIILNNFYKQKRLITVDVQGIINEYIIKLSSEKLTEKEISGKVLNFSKKLETTLKNTAQKNNIILVPQQTVFNGADGDITNEFKQILIENEK